MSFMLMYNTYALYCTISTAYTITSGIKTLSSGLYSSYTTVASLLSTKEKEPKLEVDEWVLVESVQSSEQEDTNNKESFFEIM